MSDKRVDGENGGLEAALASLTPAPSGIQRDRLMFLAGRASVGDVATRWHARRIAVWGWPCGTAASLAMAVTFALLWAGGGGREMAERARTVSTSTAQPAANIVSSLAVQSIAAQTSEERLPSQWENRRLCRLILEEGFDALPKPQYGSSRGTPPPPRHDSYRELSEQYLNDAASP